MSLVLVVRVRNISSATANWLKTIQLTADLSDYGVKNAHLHFVNCAFFPGSRTNQRQSESFYRELYILLFV